MGGWGDEGFRDADDGGGKGKKERDIKYGAS